MSSKSVHKEMLWEKFVDNVDNLVYKSKMA